MTHRIMGAGHPRLQFELDTFTATQPAHFRVDADYRRRKTSANGVQIWAIGQAMAIDVLLETLLDPKRGRDGLFPEPVLLDCHSCHTSITEHQWGPRATTGLGPGIVRINGSNLLMLQIIARRVDPALGKALASQSLALHRSFTEGYDALNNRAKAIRATIGQLIKKFAGHKFGSEDMRALLDGMLEFGLKGEFANFLGAEQATMALGAIVNAMHDTGAITKSQFTAMNKSLGGLLVAVKDAQDFQHRVFVAELRKLKGTAPK